MENALAFLYTDAGVPNAPLELGEVEAENREEEQGGDVEEENEYTKLMEELCCKVEELNDEDMTHLDFTLPAPLRPPPIDIDDIPLPNVIVSNVVCKSSVGCEINLEQCSAHFTNSKRSKKFPALFLKLHNPNITILLFTTGSVLSTGANNFEDHVISISKVIKTLILKMGYENAKLQDVKIENIVAHFEMFPIQIRKLCEDPEHSPFCKPQLKFPCINYHLKVMNPPVTLRIFKSGKVLCQAAKSLEDVYRATRYMVPVLHQFRQPPNEPVRPVTLIPLFEEEKGH
jgi:transcription initiation factor TFIID TATA-box-binding protein